MGKLRRLISVIKVIGKFLVAVAEFAAAAVAVFSLLWGTSKGSSATA